MAHARTVALLVATLVASGAGQSTVQRALDEAGALHRAAEFADAAKAYRVLWEADPDLLAAHIGYQEAAARAGQTEELVELYRDRAKERDGALDHYLYGRIAPARDAAKALGKAIDGDPGLVRARASLAHVLVEKGSLKQAAEEAELAVSGSEAALESATAETKPAATERLALCLVTRGWVHESADRAEEAMADYQRAAELDPELARAQISLGFALEASGERDDAISAFTRASQLDPVSVVAVCTLARLQHEVAQEATARDDPAAGEGGGAGDSDGEPEAEGDGDPSAPGIGVLDKAIALMPDEAQLHYTRGMILSETKGSRSAAIKSLERAIELDPEDVFSRTALAETYSRLGRHSKAQEAATEAIRVDRKSAEAYRALGLASKALADWKTAIDAFGRAMKIEPRDGNLPFWQAECYEGAADYKKAIAAYERAAQVNPQDPEAHVRMGILYEVRRSNTKEAVACYKRYVELGGTDPRVPDWIRELEKP